MRFPEGHPYQGQTARFRDPMVQREGFPNRTQLRRNRRRTRRRLEREEQGQRINEIQEYRERAEIWREGLEDAERRRDDALDEDRNMNVQGDQELLNIRQNMTAQDRINEFRRRTAFLRRREQQRRAAEARRDQARRDQPGRGGKRKTRKRRGGNENCYGFRNLEDSKLCN